MRTVVHLSDLHFGRFDDALTPPLLGAITDSHPDLVVVSGDLTQRARPAEFRQARAFLDQIGSPVLVVPGNHDLPFFNILERMLDPLRRYRRYITTDLAPVFSDDEIIAVGLNSTRSFTKRSGGGRLNMLQVDQAIGPLASANRPVTKIVVTHHPFDVPEGFASKHLIGRADRAMQKLASVGADLFLAGHLHRSHVAATAERYKIAGHSALVLQAGTLSTRQRGEVNAFNVIRVVPQRVTVERHSWEPVRRRFEVSWFGEYRHAEQGWQAARSEAAP